MDNLIRLRFVFENEQSSINLDANNKIKLIKNIIQISQKTDLNNYDIVYKNKILKNTENTIKETIGKDQMPIFYFKNKGKLIK